MKTLLAGLLIATALSSRGRAETRLLCEGHLLDAAAPPPVTIGPDQEKIDLLLFAPPAAQPQLQSTLVQSSGELGLPLAQADLAVPAAAPDQISRPLEISLPTFDTSAPLRFRLVISIREEEKLRPIGAIDLERISATQWNDALAALKATGVPILVAGRENNVRDLLSRWAMPFEDLGADLPAAARPDSLLVWDTAEWTGKLPDNTVAYLQQAQIPPFLSTIPGVYPSPVMPVAASPRLSSSFALQWQFLQTVQSALHHIKNRKGKNL